MLCFWLHKILYEYFMILLIASVLAQSHPLVLPMGLLIVISRTINSRNLVNAWSLIPYDSKIYPLSNWEYMRINDESLGMVAYGQNCLQIMTGSRQWYYQFWHKRMISLNSCRSSLQFKRKMATLISRLQQIRWIFTRRSCSPRDHRNRWREQQWENSTLPPDGPDSSVSCYKWWS